MTTWHKWPDEKPPEEGDYWVTIDGEDDLSVFGCFFDGEHWYSCKCDMREEYWRIDKIVIAWTEMVKPEPYMEDNHPAHKHRLPSGEERSL